MEIMKYKKPIALVLLVMILFTLHCAKEGMPPGGPVDTTPPEVISVSPRTDSTGVDLNSKIEITFSERMSKGPTEESIFISPFPKKPFDYKWKGKTLVLSPPGPLTESKTYVVTIGTGAQDLRRNNLSESYTFAFSTGTTLDYGSISGEVWMKQKDGFKTESGIDVWAYLFSDTMTIEPQTDKPDYITQSDFEGKYVFRNLSVGKYRLFAVEDLSRDQLWNPDIEAIGVSSRDVELASNDDSRNYVDFILALRDTTKPTLVDCQAISKNQVRLDFDENLSLKAVLDPDNFEIESKSTSEPLELNEVFFHWNDTRNIFILTAEMTPDEEYELRVLNLEDESGNPLDTSANTCLFVGSAVSDTSGPKVISTSPEDNQISLPQDAEIKLAFDEPPDRLSVESSSSLSDSNDILVPGKSRWENPNTFVFSPDTILSGRMKYQVKIHGENIFDLFGNSLADSVLSFTFTTLAPETLGSVSGLVRKTPSEPESLKENASETIVVTLAQVNDAKKRYQRTLFQPGLFLFENILPGKYIVGAYIDLNRDGILTMGEPNPFSPCEPFTFFPDTVAVRSRWETEGVELKFR